jgi:replication initiation protein RepC
MARRGRPSWRALVETASEIAPLLGIGPALWGEACGRLGRNGAAIAALILERALTRGPEDGTAAVARPAGWLRGVMARADQGRLRLDRSIRGLAQRPAARDRSWSRPPNGRSAGIGPVAWG